MGTVGTMLMIGSPNRIQMSNLAIAQHSSLGGITDSRHWPQANTQLSLITSKQAFLKVGGCSLLQAKKKHWPCSLLHWQQLIGSIIQENSVMNSPLS